MNLIDFKDKVDSERLMIATECYEQGLALRVAQTFNNRYTVWIADSFNVHTVNITVDDFFHVYHNKCSCTTNRDYECEHQITALFALQDYFNFDHLSWGFDEYKEKLEEQLLDIKKSELVDYLLEIIKKDPIITKKLLLENGTKKIYSSFS